MRVCCELKRSSSALLSVFLPDPEFPETPMSSGFPLPRSGISRWSTRYHTATSVATEGGVADHALLLAEYLGMLRLHARVEDAEVRGSVMELYRRSSETIGRPVRATTTGGDTVEGVAKDVGELGELLVETTGGVRAVAFGEVTNLR